MPQLLCGAHLQLCRIRASRLNADCTYNIDPNASVVTTAGISFNIEPEYEDGIEIIQKNGCDEICLNIKDPDELKRLTTSVELCLRDLDLLNVLTCKNVLLDGAGDTYGGSRDIGLDDCPGAFVEIWVKVGRSSGSCGTVDNAGYDWVKYVYPKVNFREDGATFANELNNLTLSGTIEANPAIAGTDGPFNDLGYDITATGVEYWTYETAAPPAADCGYGPDVEVDANTPTP